MTTTADTRTVFAVCRNGAIWSSHDTLEEARAVAARVATVTERHRSYQGFNEQGLTAVVSRPVVVRVEELRERSRGGWDCVAIRHEWMAGEAVSQAVRRFC